MSYIGTEPKDIRSFGRTKFDYTATQGQTAFTGADDDGKVLAFTVGQIEVYVNGILMDDSDFTTTGTGTVTLVTAANLNDVINIVSFESNIPDNDYVPASGGTFTGNVTHSGTVTNSSTVTNSGNVTVGGTLNATTRLQVGDSSITQAFPQSNFGYVADFQGSSGSQTYISIAAPTASSLGDNGVVIGEDATDTYITQRGNKNIKLATQDLSRVIIDGSGRVTLPYQPMFHAWCTDGGNGAVSGGNSPTSFYTSLNVGSHFSSGTFTAPIAGKYRFYYSILSGTANGGYGLIQFTVNNSGSFGGGISTNWGQIHNYGTANDKCVTRELIVSLAANDYVKLQVNSSHTNFYWSGGYSYFGGHLIG